MSASGIDGKRRRHRRWIDRLSPVFRLDADPAHAWDFDGFAAAAGGIESNALDLARFLAALGNPPRGNLGAAIRATFASGIGWDSSPGVTPYRKSGMTGGYAAYLAFDPAAKKAIFVGTNTKVSPEALGEFALGIHAGDSLLLRATAPRVPDAGEIARLKGKYRNPTPDPTRPLRALEITERGGHLVARYDFGGVNDGALLAPDASADVWNAIDGEANLDGIRILSDGIRVTLAGGEGDPATLELEKIPFALEKFPAMEGEGDAE
jgi:hypothetical protein